MMSPHFRLSSELAKAIAKRLPNANNQLSGPDSFFNQFVTDMCTSALRLLLRCGWRPICVHRRRPLGACGHH